jgi:hypothetical protein
MRLVKSQDIYNVSPSGGSNDHVAINAALQAAKTSGGGTVNLGAGSFTISQSLLIPSNVRLQGAGMYATSITMAAATPRPVIVNESGFAGNSGIQARDLTVVASSNQARTTQFPNITTAGLSNGSHYQSPLTLVRCSNVLIENVRVRVWGGNSILISGGRNGVVRNIVFDQITGASSNADGLHIMGDNTTVDSQAAVPTVAWLFENISAPNLNDNIVALIATDYANWRTTEGDLDDIIVRNVDATLVSQATVRIIAQKAGTSGTQRTARNIVIDGIRSRTTTGSVAAFEIIEDSGDSSGQGALNLSGTTSVENIVAQNIYHDCPAATGTIVRLTAGLLQRGVVVRNVQRFGTTTRTGAQDVFITGNCTDVTVDGAKDVGCTGGFTILASNVTGGGKLTIQNCVSTGGNTSTSIAQVTGSLDRLVYIGNYLSGGTYLGDHSQTASSGTPEIVAVGNTFKGAYAMFTPRVSGVYVLSGNSGSFTENVIRPNGSSIAVTIRGAGNLFSGSLSGGSIFANAAHANIRVHSPDFPVSDITRLYSCVAGDLVWRSAGTVGLHKCTVTGTAGTGGAAGTAATLVAI